MDYNEQLALELDIDGALEDAELQERYDRLHRREPNLFMILRRMRALMDAEKNADPHDIWAVRQAAVDLSSAANMYAASLPRPTIVTASWIDKRAA